MLLKNTIKGFWAYWRPTTVGSPTSEEILPLWERNEYGFGIPCRYAKAIGKYGITAGMSVPNNPGIRGIAWYISGQQIVVDAGLGMRAAL